MSSAALWLGVITVPTKTMFCRNSTNSFQRVSLCYGCLQNEPRAISLYATSYCGAYHARPKYESNIYRWSPASFTGLNSAWCESYMRRRTSQKLPFADTVTHSPVTITSCYIHCVSKKVPTFKLSVTLSNLNRFSKFLHCWKRMKFATKPMWQYPPHLWHVATLPWEIKNSNFLQILSRHCRNANILHFNRL